MAQNNLAKAFRALHKPRQPLVLCNSYDGATAKIIAAHPRSKAIASASYAIAAARGIDDDDLDLQQNLDGLSAILEAARAAGKPATVDLQDGYGKDLEAAVVEITKMGAVGCNLEDFDRVTNKLMPIDVACDRVKLAMTVASKQGIPDFVVNARTDTLLTKGTVEEAIERGKAYLAAGACTCFVWGAKRGVSRAEVEKLVQALDGRVNVKMNLGANYLTVSDLASIGVARISVGPELYMAAMAAYKSAADQLLA